MTTTPHTPADLAAEGAVSVRDAARLLGVSERAVYRLAWAGDLAHARIGRRLVLSRRAVTDYLAERLEQAQGGSAA